MTTEEKVIRTVCGSNDALSCGILAHVRNGVLTKVEPADFPDSRFRHICLRGLSTIKLAYHPDRLKYPLKRVGKRGEGKWQRISWDEALDTIASKFKEIGKKYGYESIALATGNGGFAALVTYMPIRLASALQATWVNILGFGDAAGPCGDLTSYGSQVGGLYTTSFETPGLCVLWGANYAETHPFSWRRIRDAKEAGAKVVVIDPRFTVTAAKADEFIFIRPGTDTALALGMIKIIWEKGLADETFIIDHTVGPFLVRFDAGMYGGNGMFLRERDIISTGSDKYVIWDTQTNKPRTYDEGGVTPAITGTYQINGIECKPSFQLLLDLAKQYPLEKAAEITEIPPEAIERLAIDYATRKPVASYRHMGLQRTFYGDVAFRAITALAAVTGNHRLLGYGRFDLRIGGFTRVMDQNFKSMPLLQMYETVLTGQPYPIKALWLSGHNFMLQNPDNNKVIRELVPRLDFIVVIDRFMNASAQYADIVLPVCSSYECTDLVTPAGTPYLQLRPEVIEPLYESKSDLDIINGLAAKLGLGEHFNRNAEECIEFLLSSRHPSEGITLERLKEGPVSLPRLAGAPVFRTPSGRIEFYSETMRQFGQELPVYIEPLEGNRRPLAEKYPLSYISTHTKYRTHSVFNNVDWLKELDPEPVLGMHPVDAEGRGIRDGDTVVVFNDRGQVKLRASLHRGIKPGVVNIRQGWWHEQYTEGSHQALTHAAINPAQMAVFQPNTALNDCLVEVKKAEV